MLPNDHLTSTSFKQYVESRLRAAGIEGEYTLDFFDKNTYALFNEPYLEFTSEKDAFIFELKIGREELCTWYDQWFVAMFNASREERASL